MASNQLTLYWLKNSRAQRIVWLLEELKLNFKIEEFDRTKDNLSPPEAFKIHPLGHFPMVRDSDGKLLVESGFIVNYLIKKYGKLGNPTMIPTTEDAQNSVEYFVQYAEGTLMPFLVFKHIFNVIHSQSPFFIRPIINQVVNSVGKAYLNPNIKRNFKYLNDTLEGHTYFVGNNLTGADIMLSYPIESAAQHALITAEEHPNLIKWLDTIRALPSYKKAAERTKSD